MSGQVKITVQGPQQRGHEGLKDGGHIYLSCSNCQAGLMDFWVTRPNEIDPATGKVVEWTVKCNCPFCGDESFQKTFSGGFYPAGYGIPKPESPEEDVIPSTIWDHFEPKSGVLVFRVLKANKDAKPFKVRS